MDIVIREVKNDDVEIENVTAFLFDQIKKAYGIGPTPKFHYDIFGLKKLNINLLS